MIKTLFVLRWIESRGLNNSQYNTLKTSFNDGNSVEFIKNYFGGKLVSGSLKNDKWYIAFWEDAPRFSPSAIVTDTEGYNIKVFELI